MNFRPLAFSPDGTRAAVAIIRGVRIHPLLGDSPPSEFAIDFTIESVAFGPHGKRILVGGSKHNPGTGYPSRRTGVIELIDTNTGKTILRLEQEHAVQSVAFSSDGKWIAAGTGTLYHLAPRRPGELAIWDATTGHLKHKLKGHGFWITSVAFSPDGQTLASASTDETIKLWSMKTGACTATLRGHEKWIRSVAFSPDGRQLASVADDQTVRIWDVLEHRCLITLRGHKADRFEMVAFSEDGNRVVAAGNKAKVWDLNKDLDAEVFIGHKYRVSCVAFSPDGSQIATASIGKLSGMPGSLLVRERPTGAYLFSVRPSRGAWGIRSIAYSRDGSRLAADVGAFVGITIRNSIGGKEIGTLPVRGQVNDMAWSPDGGQLAVASFKGIHIWSADKQEELLFFRAHHTNHTTAIAYSSDGTLLASADWRRGEVTLSNPANGERIRAVRGGGRGLAFTPDGKHFASGCKDGSVKLWSTATGELVRSFARHNERVNVVAISPDGQRLVSGGLDRRLKLWDLKSGLELLTLSAHSGPILDMSISPDGKLITVSGEDKTIRTWAAPSFDHAHVGS